MTQALLIIATAMGTITALLACTIVLHKIRFDRRALRRERRLDVLRPRIEAYLDGQFATLGDALKEVADPRDGMLVPEILLHRIEGAKRSIAHRAARALEEWGAVESALEALGRREWWLRAEAAENLGLARAHRAQDALLDALEDENTEVRFRAARALGRLGDPNVARDLILTLNRPDRFSTTRIATVLISMGPRVCEPITTCFDLLEPRARVAAMDVLSAVGAAQWGRWIQERLDDEHVDVRCRAAKSLGAIADRSAAPRLVESLRDPEWPVRAAAAKALEKLQYTRSVPNLCDALRDSEWWVRTNAAEALRGLGKPGLTGLETMVDDDDIYARHQAVFMLEQSGVLEERVSKLFDISKSQRDRSRNFVEQVIESGQCGMLTDISEEHSDLQIRAFLADALQRNEMIPEIRA